MFHSTYRRPRRAGLLAVGTAICCLLAACSGTAGSARGSDEFTVGVLSNFMAHLLPGRTASTSVDYAVWTPLTTIDPETGEVRNAVARSIETSDNKVWTITLKQGWTFHNGDPVTAQSFADSWNTTAYGPNAITGNFQFSTFAGYADLNPATGEPTTKRLSGVEVADEHTLRVTLTRPLSMLPYLLAQSTFAPLSKTDLRNLKKADRRPNGNGPYRVTGEGIRTGAAELTLQRYDRYAGAAGKARRIVVKAYQDETAVYTDYRAGRIDVANVSGQTLASAVEQYRDKVVRLTYPAVVYLGFPLWDERFADRRIREAFSLAVDRKAIVTSLLHGLATPATGLAPESVTGGGVENCLPCDHDPDRARTLLADAGGWQGELRLWTSQDPTNSAVLEAIANQLRANLGIKDIAIKAQPAEQLYPNMAARKTDGPMLLYMGATYPHVYALADQLFTKGSGTNVTGFDNARVARLLAEAAGAEPDQAVTLSQQAVRAAMDELPLAPLYHPMGGLLHSAGVDGLTPEVLGGAKLAGVTVS